MFLDNMVVEENISLTNNKENSRVGGLEIDNQNLLENERMYISKLTQLHNELNASNHRTHLMEKEKSSLKNRINQMGDKLNRYDKNENLRIKLKKDLTIANENNRQ